MSTADMQGIPSFPEPQEELHLSRAFRICWQRCLPLWQSASLDKASASRVVAQSNNCTGHCKIHRLCAILQHLYPSLRTSDRSSSRDHYQIGIHRPSWSIVERLSSAINGRSQGSHPLRSLSDALQPQTSHHPSHRFLIPRIWLRC